MTFEFFNKYVLPGIIAEHKTVEKIKQAIQEAIKADPITEGTEVLVLDVKEVKGADGNPKIQVIKSTPEVDPSIALKAEMERMALEAIKSATATLKSTNDKHIVVRGDREDQDPTGGYKYLGEMCVAVRNAVVASKAGSSEGRPDDRLKRLMAKSAALVKTPTAGNTGSTGDGGALVPTEFENKLRTIAYEQSSLLGRLDDSIKIQGNHIRVPISEETAWGTDGIFASWTGENVQITDRKPALNEQDLSLNSLKVLIPLTNELIDDSAIAVDGYVYRQGGNSLSYKLTDAVVNGTGSGMPLGFMKSAALIEVDRKTGGQINTKDVQKMFGRLYQRWAKDAVWLANQTLFDQLVDLPNISAGTAFPLYMPPGYGGNDSEFGTMYGKPVIFLENMAPLGTSGDLVLCSPGQYLLMEKAAGVVAAQSIHLYFDFDATAIRLVLRADGRPWQTKPITLPTSAGFAGTGTGDSEGTVSSFVSLR